MATEWFYEKDGEKLGPVSTDRLKDLAASGQLNSQDLVWRTGLEAWQPADRVRGLFPGGTVPPPLPIPTSERPSKLGPARKPSDPKQQSSAKPGNGILDAAKGIADKARGFAGSDEVKDAVGRTKKAVAEVGDRAKDAARKAREYAGSDEVKDAVGKSKKAAAAIGGRALRAIREVNKTTNASGSDATDTDQPSGSRIRDNALVIALSMICCFPLGLVFVWTSPRWSTGQKGAWTALLLPLFMLGSCAQKASIHETEETARLLTEGDRLWDAGNRDEAAAKYREAWTEHKLTMRSKELVGPHLPRFYTRLIDHEVVKGDRDLAKELSREAAKGGIALSLQGEEARKLHFPAVLDASDGQKLAAFQAVVAKFKAMPDELAGQTERKAYYGELEKVIDKFAAIPFDATLQADEGKEIVRLFEAELAGRYKGYTFNRTEEYINRIIGQLQNR